MEQIVDMFMTYCHDNGLTNISSIEVTEFGLLPDAFGNVLQGEAKLLITTTQGKKNQLAFVFGTSPHDYHSLLVNM